jgi:hypothetical protein
MAPHATRARPAGRLLVMALVGFGLALVHREQLVDDLQGADWQLLGLTPWHQTEPWRSIALS